MGRAQPDSLRPSFLLRRDAGPCGDPGSDRVSAGVA